MFKFSGFIKKLAGMATALTTTIAVGCHMSEPKCYYGPAPMPEKDVVDDNDTIPEVLEDESGESDYRNYPPTNSNEALDVYGPPPHELDDPDINPDMLDEPEPAKPSEPKKASDSFDYPKSDEPPVMRALYGVQLEVKDK